MRLCLFPVHFMPTPSVDILVPVWNNPFETRACLAAILKHSPDARLIVVANGCSRETELMLEEFFEPLGERALFLLSDRNLGLVPAVNQGLARSDSDYTVIVRPNVMVCHGWLDAMLKSAEASNAGLVTPIFYGDGMPDNTTPIGGCTLIETCLLSFSTLLIKGEMRMLIGSFDEGLDGGENCLLDYLLRAGKNGYRTYCSAQPRLLCSPNTVFGSAERIQAIQERSRTIIRERWGDKRRFYVYCGNETRADEMHELVEALLQQSRKGAQITLLLHWRQYRECIKRGWNGLHTNFSLRRLAFLRAERELAKIAAGFNSSDDNEFIAVRGTRQVPFPGVTDAQYWEELFGSVKEI